MLSINDPNIHPLFLHAFIRYYNLTIELMSLKKIGKTYQIGNEAILNLGILAYSQFQNWIRETDKNVSLETISDFFDRDIVLVNVTNGIGFVKQKTISRIPLFIAKNSKNKNSYLLGDFILNSRHPIQMPLNLILKFHNLSEETQIDFETCNLNIQLVKVENNVAFTDSETPGNFENSIVIGKCDNDYFWIPNKNILRNRFYCTKLPGKCEVFFYKKAHLDAHMAICTDQTKIISCQVGIFSIIKSD